MSRLSETLTAKAAELGITQTELAERTDMLQQSISALFNGDVASPRRWREIARVLQIPEEQMREMMIEAGRESGKNTRLPRSVVAQVSHRLQEERTALDEGPAVEPNARIDTSIPIPFSVKPGRMIPVLGEAVGGSDGEYEFNGQVLDYIACPPSLANVPNAYGVYVDGESMSPRYRPGETVYVHPGKPARRGDDVIVQVAVPDDGRAPHGFIKEFVGWTNDELILRQYNPESKIKFERYKVVSVHPIVLAGKY